MVEMSDSEIKHILSLYKTQREKDKERYKLVKDTDEFKRQNRARAKAHYEKTKDIRKQRYINNRELQIAKNSYYYYQRTNNVKTFMEKYPERYEMLHCVAPSASSQQSLNAQNPSLSMTTSSSSSSPLEQSLEDGEL